MRWIFIGISTLIILLLWPGCKYNPPRYTESARAYRAPSWTSDNKVVFIEDSTVWEYEEGNPLVGDRLVRVGGTLWLCECNKDGSDLHRVGKILEEEDKHWFSTGMSTSSAGEWVAIGLATEWDEVENEHTDGEIWIMKRNGEALEKVADHGLYPDFSPDASKIVYQKPNQGIWIMNRDGSNDHCIVSDSSALSPAWSFDGQKIAYSPGPKVVDTSGSLIKNYSLSRVLSPDWSSAIDTLGVGNGLTGKVRLICLTADIVDTMNVYTGGTFKWSLDGTHFIGYDENGYFVIERDGTNKWYIKP